MSRLKLAATAAALVGGLALSSAAQAFTFLDLSSTGLLYDYDSASGTLTAAGNQTGAGDQQMLEGLGQLGTAVYGYSSAGELYSITESAGVITETALGASGLGTSVTFVDFGSTTGALYAIGSNGDLYTISSSGATKGQAMLVGSLGLTGTQLSNLTNHMLIGLSTGSSTLYFDDGTTMYTINGSGHATSVGTISGGPTDYGALLWVTAAEAGPLTPSGLYGGTNSDNAHGKSVHTGLSLFNNTYVATLVSESTPNNSKITQFYGMAPGFSFKVLPEPSEWALMLVGVGAVGGALRARRRKATAKA